MLSVDRQRFKAGQPPAVALQLEDVNGDGLLDLLRLAEGGLTVFLQDGAGRFNLSPAGSDVAPPSGSFFSDLATGSLQPNNVLPDVVVLGGNGQVEILGNLGAAGLKQVLPSPVSPPFNAPASQVLVADLDGALGDDLLVLLDGLPPLMFLADGGGGFQDVTRGKVPLGLSLPRPRGVVADFDGDGDPDVVLSSSGTPPVLLTNDGVAGLSLSAGAFPPISLPVSRLLAAHVFGGPVPDLVFGLQGPAAGSAIVYRNMGGVFLPVAGSRAFETRGVRELLAGDWDGDGELDLIALQEDGAVVFGRGSGTGGFGPAEVLLQSAPRGALAVGDLEGDGDLDLVTGGAGLEDQILLGNGTGGFLDTEATDFPIGRAPGVDLGALLDVDGNLDPDLVVYDQRGRPTVFYNDGSARFRILDTGALPMLPGGNEYRRVLASSVARPGRHDLLVVASGNATAPFRVLVNRGGVFADQTGPRWLAGQVPDVVAAAAGPLSSSGSVDTRLDDVVLADSTGALHLAQNRQGVFGLVTGAFPGPLLTDPRRVLLGDVNGDGNDDVVALQNVGTVRVFLGSGSGAFSERLSAVVPGYPAREGELVDLNGDRYPDLVLVPPEPKEGLVVLFGDGTGGFADVTVGVLTAQPRGHITDLAHLDADGDLHLLVAVDDAPDQILEWQDSGFGNPVELPFRGSVRTEAMLAGDLDRDGDPDVVTLRRETMPALLRDSRLHLSTTGTPQIGRVLGLRLVPRTPMSVISLFLGLSASPTPFPPFGILRIHAPILLWQGAVPPGRTELIQDWPLPASLLPGEVRLQAAFWDLLSLDLQLSNLEIIELTDH